MFQRKLLFLFGIMLLLSFAGYGICKAAGEEAVQEKTEKVRLVSSFYPIYILTKNLTEGAADTTVTNLTQNQAGCLHDYQLTAKDMKLLSTADALVINGAGIELFLTQAAESLPDLRILATVQETDLVNGHVWMDVSRYRMQAAVLCEELKKLDVPQAEVYEAAYRAYDQKLGQLSLEVQQLLEKTKGIPAVLFHEAFVPFAESLGMEVLAELTLDEEELPGAGEIAEIVEKIRNYDIAFLFVEEAYASYAHSIAKETGAVLVYLDPLVAGEGGTDSYLSGMRNNLASVEAALENTGQ